MDCHLSRISSILDLRGVSTTCSRSKDPSVEDHVVSGRGFTIQIHPNGEYIVYNNRPVIGLSELFSAMLDNDQIPADSLTSRVDDIEVVSIEGVHSWLCDLYNQGFLVPPENCPFEAIDDKGNPLLSITECTTLEEEFRVAALICSKYNTDICHMTKEILNQYSTIDSTQLMEVG